MNKIITLFQRNYETDKLVRDEVTPGAEWVIAGEGVAARKFDGTCCMVKGGKLYRRYEARVKNPPGAALGEAHQNSKLTDAEALEIKRRYKPGTGSNNRGNVTALSKEFGVSKGVIRAAGDGTSYSHLNDLI